MNKVSSLPCMVVLTGMVRKIRNATGFSRVRYAQGRAGRLGKERELGIVLRHILRAKVIRLLVQPHAKPKKNTNNGIQSKEFCCGNITTGLLALKL